MMGIHILMKLKKICVMYYSPFEVFVTTWHLNSRLKPISLLVKMALFISHGPIDLLKLSRRTYQYQFHYDKHSSTSFVLQMSLFVNLF